MNIISFIADELYICYQNFLTINAEFIGFSTFWDFLIAFFIFGEVVYILFGIDFEDDD